MHKQKTFTLITIAVLAFIATIWLTRKDDVAPNTGKSSQSDTKSLQPFRNKAIVWVDSYHKGYEWSNGIEAGIRDALEGSGAKLICLKLDAKRNPNEKHCKDKSLSIKQKIDNIKPDVIIASDDHAQKYLIVPYYKNTKTPVVFCGVNWSAKEYGYPSTNITGMVEVDLVKQLMQYLQRHAKGERVAYVSTDDLTERKMFNEQNRRFFNGKMLPFLAKAHTFKDYTETFMRAQNEADMILLSNNAGISDWNRRKAEKFFRENTLKPTGAINKWMTGYAMATFCKLPEEQGEWAAQSALKILSGTPPTEIPVTHNKKGKLFINMNIADKLNIVFPLDILRNAEIHSSPKDEHK